MCSYNLLLNSLIHLHKASVMCEKVVRNLLGWHNGIIVGQIAVGAYEVSNMSSFCNMACEAINNIFFGFFFSPVASDVVCYMLRQFLHVHLQVCLPLSFWLDATFANGATVKQSIDMVLLIPFVNWGNTWRYFHYPYIEANVGESSCYKIQSPVAIRLRLWVAGVLCTCYALW